MSGGVTKIRLNLLRKCNISVNFRAIGTNTPIDSLLQAKSIGVYIFALVVTFGGKFKKYVRENRIAST